MTEPIIAPSILSADFGRLAEQVQAVETAGADWIHVDVMDGRFVPPITIGPAITAAVRKTTSLPIDVHLMVVEPERHIQAFRDAGADRITVHIEACAHIHRVLDMIRQSGALAGVALNPGTTLAAIEEVLDHTDLVLVMTVNPGWGGQNLIESAVEKMRRLRSIVESMEQAPLIEVDGGVKTSNAGLFSDADVLVAGSAIYGAEDYGRAMQTIRKSWKKGGVGS